MGWLLSLVIAALTAVAGCLGAGALAGLCVGWYRISSREGASGYFIIFIGLVGLVAGFVLGLVCARLVAAGPSPGFLKGLGVSLGTTAGLLGMITFLCWVGADLPPELEGHELVVEAEVRLPEGRTPPPAEDTDYTAAHVTITADSGARHQSLGPLRLKEARQEGGRWIVPATVPLTTSDPGKSLGVQVGEGKTQYFRFPLPGRPTRADMAWSGWLQDATRDSQPVPAAEALAVRYRVQFYAAPPPPPPGPDPAAVEAEKAAAEDAAFAALTPASPLSAWLAFTHYSKPPERRKAAADAISRRPDVVPDLSKAIRSADRDEADLALRAVGQMKEPPAGLAPAVQDVAREIAAEIRVVNATTAAEDPSYEKAAAAEVRFAGWSEAARVLHGRSGVDMRPAMQEILDLARVRSESVTMQDVARVSGFYVKEWGPSPKGTPAP